MGNNVFNRLANCGGFDNSIFNALYQGIPVGGYTKMIANMLDGIEVRLNVDYLENKEEIEGKGIKFEGEVIRRKEGKTGKK